jgi:hypothetical protein
MEKEQVAFQSSAGNVAEVAATTSTTTLEANQANKDMKEEIAKYWNYIKTLLKNPTQSFQLKEEDYIYGIINVALYAITFAISAYYMTNAIYEISFGLLMGESLPFFPIASKIVLYVFIALMVVSAVTVAVEKISIKQFSFKTLFSQFAGLLAPFIFIQVVAIITGIAGSLIITFLLLLSSLFFAIFILPGLFMFEKASFQQGKSQKVYISLGTTIAIIFIAYLAARSALGELVLDFLDDLLYLF